MSIHRNDATRAIKSLLRIGDAIIETVAEAGDEGAPAGPLYAAMSVIGCSYDTFERIMSILVDAGRLRRSGNVYFAVKSEG